MNRGFIQIPILIAILAGIAVFGGAGYVAYEASQKSSVPAEESVIESTTEASLGESDDVSTTSAVKTNNDIIQKEMPASPKAIVSPVIPAATAPSTSTPTQISLTAQIQTPTSTASTTASAPTPTVAPAVTPTPKVKVTASPENVEYNGTSVISWVATDALSCTLGSSPVLLAVTGSHSVEPTDPGDDWTKTNKKTYSITCTGTGGSVSEDVTVTVQSWVPPAGYKVLPYGQCTRATAPCITGPGFGTICEFGGGCSTGG